MLAQISRLEIEELDKRVTWLFTIRWFTSIIIFVLILISNNVLNLQIKIFPTILIPIAIFFYNFVFSFFIDNIRRRTLFRLVNLQLFLDITFILLLTYFTGGVENQISFLCVFFIIFAGILLPPQNCIFITFYTILVYNLMVWLVFYQIIPFYHIFPHTSKEIFLNKAFISINSIFFSLVMIISALSTISIMDKLRTKESRIIHLQSITKKQKKELEEKAEKLKKLDTLKSSFMLQVEHQLKSPLVGSLSIIDILLNRYNRIEDKEKKKMLVAILKKLKFMHEMIIDLLTLANIKDPDYNPDAEKNYVDLNRLIQKIVASLEDFIKKKHNQVIFKLDNSIEKILINEKQISLCITNIIHNAIKYTDNGKITITTMRDKDRIKIDVSDTGVGIKEEEMKKIFKEFYRSSEVKEKGIEGTGLGLYIAYEVAKKLGGNIKVRSKIGEGSTFTITIPLAT